MTSNNDSIRLRRNLEETSGPEYWKSLEELAGHQDDLDRVGREFPDGASEWPDVTDRRRFLKLMGSSLALAGIQGCVSGPPQEEIVPYVREPEQVVPGRPQFFATAFPFRGHGQGVLVESHAGRPTKVEGNPDHPSSVGATSAFAQASVLGLYDRLRSTTPLRQGNHASWERFVSELHARIGHLRQNGGRGLRILTETVTSPTLGSQLRSLLADYPEARWYRFDSVGSDNVEQGLARVFGRPAVPLYRFDRAQTIAAFDADFLFALPGSVRYARDWARRRRVRRDETGINRMYVVESSVTITGAMADHRLALRPSKISGIVHAVAARMGIGDGAQSVAGVDEAWLEAMVDDLMDAASPSLVVAGEGLEPELYELVHGMNERLNASGDTVTYAAPADERPAGGFGQFATLVEDMRQGAVDVLVMLGGNPAYAAPVDLAFREALANVPFSIHLSLHDNETSGRSTWHVPRTHYLETWSDIRAHDGTPSIIQPLIAPLYVACRSEHELIAMIAERPGVSSYDLVRDYWRSRLNGDFEPSWQEVLRAGVIPDEVRTGGETVAPGEGEPEAAPSSAMAPTADDGSTGRESLGSTADRPIGSTADRPLGSGGGRPLGADPATRMEPVPPSPSSEYGEPAASSSAREESPDHPSAVADIELVFRPDPTIWDGVFATNGWLQELPKPLTKLTWDNAALIAPDLAERLGIESEQLVRIQLDGRTMDVAAWIVPGHPDGTITLTLGYGRDRLGGDADARAPFERPAESRASDADSSTFRSSATGATASRLSPAGTAGAGLGFDAGRLRTTRALWNAVGATVEPLPGRYPLATTQHHHSMEGRSLVQEMDIEYLIANPGFIKEKEHERHSLYPEYDYEGYKWGMVIDTNTCVGCNACIVACQAENNIPVVGKDEVGRGREMHWIRVDRYYKGSLRNPETFFQPVPCMHCEKAPCEVVCPVYATVHDAEGLNVMVYNRCIGTRYCSNNCPYKVRRFNFLQYADWSKDARALQRNPDVTVRSRGVMEKCTYCQQRINHARIRAKKEGRSIRDGEVITACQAACPTEAIVFGDLNDASSRVRNLHDQPHNYELLGELGTRPRTTYLAHLRNPNARAPVLGGPERNGA